MPLLSVFLLSLCSLLYEVLLARFFSITQWNHLSFMVISIALFGFGASGTFLNLLSLRFKGWQQKLVANNWIFRIVCVFSFSIIISFLLANIMPLDYFNIPLDLIQVLYLFLTFFILSVPFFFSGLITSLAYSALPQKSGLIYFVSMSGSTLGALLPLFLLPRLEEGGTILISALLPLLLIILVRRKIMIKLAVVMLIIGTCVFLFLFNGGSFIDVKPSSYKTLAQVLQYPDSYIKQTVHTMRGRVDLVESPSIRFAPGLSVGYTEILPSQQAVIMDGDDQTVLYNLEQPEDLEFIKSTLVFSAYTLLEQQENVCVIQQGGGLAILCPLFSQARNITLIEKNPEIARHIEQAYRLSRVKVECDNPRTFLANTEKKFDIIHIENWGTSMPGMASLNQEYLFTVEAVKQYFKKLSQQGMVVISRKLLLPPSDSMRIFVTALLALQELEIEQPLKHIVMLRDWGTYTLLLSARPFTQLDIEKIDHFCRNLNFDFIYHSKIKTAQINRYNVLKEPYYHNAILSVIQNMHRIDDFLAEYYIDIKPSTDNRPYQNSFIKWNKLGELNRASGERPYILIISGEIIVWIVFGIALIISILILLLPIFVVYRKKKKPGFSLIVYFLGLGAGFMFLELAFIKQYTFLLGDPVLSLMLVLCVMLVASGLGGLISHKLGRENFFILFIIILSVISLAHGGLSYLLPHMMTISLGLRIFCMILILIPISIIIGIPFPLGLRLLLKTPEQRAYCWAVNGCTSVLASILAVPLAMGISISFVMLAAEIAYVFGLIVVFIKFQN